jgi:hypothetical protein
MKEVRGCGGLMPTGNGEFVCVQQACSFQRTSATGVLLHKEQMLAKHLAFFVDSACFAVWFKEKFVHKAGFPIYMYNLYKLDVLFCKLCIL